MPRPERVFLDWSQSTAKTVACWLAGSAAPGQCLDLSDTLVLVPTRQAARRLRHELACASPCGVLSPETMTPAQFLRPEGHDIASTLESVVAFLNVFAGFDPENLVALFPNGVPFRTFEERAHFARAFFDLRASLADANWTLRAADRRLGDIQDSPRWNLLATLEQAYLDALRRRGLRDRDAARIELAAAPAVSAGIRRIVVAGVADLSPLVERALDGLPSEIVVRILTLAPPDSAERFDAWGRPLGEGWRDRDPGWHDFDAQVHLCARAEDVSSCLAAILPRDVVPDPAFLEIGALDRDLLPALRSALVEAGGSLHDPEGLPLDRHWLGRVLRDWSRFLSDPAFQTAADLLRNGAIDRWLSRKMADYRREAALRDADTIRANHFPASAVDGLGRCEPSNSLARALTLLLDLRHHMTGRSWNEHLRAFLGELADEDSLEALDAITESLDAVASLVSRYSDISPSDWLHLVTSSLADRPAYPGAEADAVQASGWLELPWSDAPHLVLTGFSQHAVPAPPAHSPFLTAPIRERLALPTDEQRATRDAYFLSRLLAMRRHGRGRVDVLVCQIDSGGVPHQPSPLLFAGSGDALPARIHRLFAEPRPAQADPAWEAPWRLAPPRVELKRQLRVTGFREYLACPFEFYLRFGLGMEPFDADPMEMDARVFGSLVHDTIERFSKDAAMKDLADPRDIRAAVSEILDDIASRRFEQPFSLPLLVQLESAHQRLAAFAREQAALRRLGWRIAHAEITFVDFLGGRPWILDGWEIRGKIDRIDFHEPTGGWRVLDYKTSDKPVAPEKAHIRGGADRDWPPDYARVASLSRWWTNLQLPLYRQLLLEAGCESATCGYFNLPKTASEAGVLEWEEFDAALTESATHCARGVLADIQRGCFWPPNPHADYAQNAGWFHPEAEHTVAADSWLRQTAP